MPSVIDDAKLFLCTACGSHPGEECWPRNGDDANWVHTQRRKVMEYNTGLARAL